MLRNSLAYYGPWQGASIALLIGIAAILLSACNTTGVDFEYDKQVARFVLESEGTGSLVTLPVSQARIQVNPKAVLTEFDIVSVDVTEHELGTCLQFTLTPQATRAFYRTSATHLGKRLVLLVNGRALGLQRMERPVGNGVLYVFVEIPNSDLEEMARNLRGTSIELQRKISG